MRAAGPPDADHARPRRSPSEWLARFEGAGLDGVIASRPHNRYEPGKRPCSRSSTCARPTASSRASAGTRAAPDAVGSLLLGLYDDAGHAAPRRRDVVLHDGAAEAARGRARAAAQECARRSPVARLGGRGGAVGRMPGAQSRWSAGKDLSWEPLRIERVCEVKYDHLQGDRFRHATIFVRWRPDRQPHDCRYDQLEVTPPYELGKVFGPSAGSSPTGASAAEGTRRPRPPSCTSRGARRRTGRPTASR
jgi:ATP-dependent DNA ligase